MKNLEADDSETHLTLWTKCFLKNDVLFEIPKAKRMGNQMKAHRVK